MKKSQRASGSRVVLYRRVGVPLGWLEGTMLAERRLFRFRYVDLAKVRRVRLLANQVGGAYLAAEDRDGRWAGCQVLVIGLNSERHLSAEVLDLICAALEKSGEEPSALAVRAKLQEQ